MNSPRGTPTTLYLYIGDVCKLYHAEAVTLQKNSNWFVWQSYLSAYIVTKGLPYGSNLSD